MPDSNVQSLIDDPAIESVEIKLSVRADQEQMVHSALRREDVEPEHRQVFFFDTDDLDLYESGLVLRARKVDGDTDNSTVKLRPVVPADIAERWKRLAEFNIEVDAVGENMVCSAKLDSDQKGGEIDSVMEGKKDQRKLFTSEQEDLVSEFAPGGVEWDQIHPLGPVETRRYEVEMDELDHELTVEVWMLPDGNDLVELSINVTPDEAEEAGRDLREFLESQGFDLGGDQQTKTRAALDFFTDRSG
jgi:uncharacterized protein YjbK